MADPLVQVRKEAIASPAAKDQDGRQAAGSAGTQGHPPRAYGASFRCQHVPAGCLNARTRSDARGLVSSAISASAAEPSGLAGPGRSARVERQRVDLVLLGVAINTVRGGVSGNGATIGSTTTPGGVSGTGVSTPYPVGFVHGVGGVEMHVGLMTAALLASFGSVSLSFYVQPVGITADGVVLPVPEPRTCALLLVGVAVLLASYLFGPRWPWARLLRRVFASRSSSVCCGGPRRSWAR